MLKYSWFCSVSVFGVSAGSMQCSYDSRGNSVPTILLRMQERLYSQGGLKSEGIFRINPENSKEEYVRDQLNRGIVPQDIDVHCLAGLIKAWFRELPSGILDGLSPEEVLRCNTEEESVELVKQLKPTEAALLNWAVDLMADVVEQEDSNKMNARNIAMVFAPNMTQMSDPLTALMHAVQVMNLLKKLIMKTLQEREEASTGEYSPMSNYSSHMLTDFENTSCELIASPSNHIAQVDYNTYSDTEDEIESTHETKKYFSKQVFDDKEKTSNSFTDKLGDLQREASPTSSRLSTTDGEGSGLSSVDIIEFRVGKSKSEHGKITTDGNKVDKLMNISYPVPLCV